jgi:hypothetical protein
VPAQDRLPAHVVHRLGLLAVRDHPVPVVLQQDRPPEPQRELVDRPL